MPFPIAVGPLTLTSVAAASNYTTTYTGAITGGGSNLFVGLRAYIVGFLLSDGVNNSGQDGFLVTANSTATITVANPNGMSETAAGSIYLFAANTVSSGSSVFGPPIPVVNDSGPYGNVAGFGPATNPGAGGAGLDSPGSPGGKSLVARNFFSGWNFVNSELSIQSYLAALNAAKNSGAGWSAVDGTNPPSPPGKNVAQTAPPAPSGNYTQQGSPVLTNVTAVTLAGFAPGQCSFVQSTGAYQSK